MNNATATISARILALIAEGFQPADAVDAVLGAGTTAAIASDVYDAMTK